MRLSASLLLVVLVTPLLDAQVTFTNVVGPSGTEYVSYGRGSGMVDIDVDGRLDIFAFVAEDPTRAFRQLPDRSFADMTIAWGLGASGQATWSGLAGDFDNDGDPDLFLANGGFQTSQINTLYRNDVTAGGEFENITATSGLPLVAERTFGSTTLDYDLDGDLDLFWANNADGCRLLSNDGDLRFTDVSVAAGVDIVAEHRHCSAGDYNNDGWFDVGVGVGAGGSHLYRNNADGTFTDVAAAAGVDTPDRNFGVVFEDFDNDGWQDLFIPKYQGQAITTISRIFMNDGDGTFTDVSVGAGMTGQTDMGHNVGDVDADGFPDIYIGTGHPQFASLDILYLVTPDGSGGVDSVDVSASSGITAGGIETRCHGMAYGDYDDDGDQDLYINNGGPEWNPATAEPNFFLQNDGNDNGWFKLAVEGVVSSRTPVGLRARATLPSGREIHRMLYVGKGFGNTDSPILHFGLGDEQVIERLDVRWPRGIGQTVYAPQAGTTLSLVETGLLTDGPAPVGGTLTLTAVGPAGDQVDLFLAATTALYPLFKYQGYLLLQPPLFTIGSFPLGPDGQAIVPFPIPNDPLLAGLDLPMQAWIRPPGATAGMTLTNLVSLAVQ